MATDAKTLKQQVAGSAEEIPSSTEKVVENDVAPDTAGSNGHVVDPESSSTGKRKEGEVDDADASPPKKARTSGEGAAAATGGSGTEKPEADQTPSEESAEESRESADYNEDSHDGTGAPPDPSEEAAEGDSKDGE